MKTLLLSFLFAVCGAVSTADSSVYICTGPYATKYHSTPECKGLNRCSGDVVKMSMDKAKESGYTACKICW